MPDTYIYTGGSAFPHPSGADIDDSFPQESGMTLRDCFAGKALAGAMSGSGTDVHDHIMARRCYEIADAMLKARDVPPKD